MAKKENKIAGDGDNVTVEYEGKTDGKVFDKGKIEFVIGSGDMIEGFDKGVIGMKEGESKTVIIKPKEAYGDHDLDMLTDIPMERFRRIGIVPKKGSIMNLDEGSGRVVSVRDTAVTVDFNHFLAGKTLIF